MLTRNFVEIFFQYLTSMNGSVTLKTMDDYQQAVTVRRTQTNVYVYATVELLQTLNPSTKNVITNTTSSTFVGFAFGTGNVTATFDDTKMDGELITTLVIDANTVSTTIDGNKTKYVQSLTVRNTGTEAVTIKEVGRVLASTSWTEGKLILIDRVVLDAPLTLAPQESGVIRLTVNMPIV